MPEPDDLMSAPLTAALPQAMLALVDELTSTMFCLKDAAGRYVAVNPTFVQRTNERSARRVLGRTAPELFVPELAERYEEQDGQVLATGLPLRNELELIRPPGGVARWYLTAKHPLVHAGDVVGLVSISQDLGNDVTDDPDMRSLSRVVEHIEAHLDGPIRVADLAQVAGVRRRRARAPGPPCLPPLPRPTRAHRAHRSRPHATRPHRHPAGPDRAGLRVFGPGGLLTHIRTTHGADSGAVPALGRTALGVTGLAP